MAIRTSFVKTFNSSKPDFFVRAHLTDYARFYTAFYGQSQKIDWVENVTLFRCDTPKLSKLGKRRYPCLIQTVIAGFQIPKSAQESVNRLQSITYKFSLQIATKNFRNRRKLRANVLSTMIDIIFENFGEESYINVVELEQFPLESTVVISS